MWQGFEQVDLEAIIDLKKIIEINRIAVGFLHEISSWIFLPQFVEFFLSDDGRQFVSVGKIKNTVSNQTIEPLRMELGISLNKLQGRFVKVFAKNLAVCPEWHEGAGNKAWLFADEVVVQ